MTTLTIELPEELTMALHDRSIPDSVVQQFVVQAVTLWLQSNPVLNSQGSEAASSIFGQSALPFIERLIDENQTLFERLATL
jgi:hypothetical protein